MKTIGLLGGMSWKSTLSYYRLINEEVKARLGGLHSARICLYSVDFDPLEKLQQADDWEGIERLLTAAARKVEAGGADFLLICTNTMHRVAPQLERHLAIPLLHIADAAAERLGADGIRRLYLEIIAGLAARGAEAVILGCTEIALLVRQEHTPVPLYDTTAIHARRAVDRALEG